MPASYPKAHPLSKLKSALKKIDFKISQGTPKHIAIAQGWKEHNKNKPLTTDKNQPSINTSDDKLINKVGAAQCIATYTSGAAVFGFFQNVERVLSFSCAIN